VVKAAILLTFWVISGISLGGFLFAASRLFPRPVELSELAAYRWVLLMLSAAVVGLTYVLCVLASR
jgi:hypothetical protein